jgi:protein-S-isoprenylcysteine O-methyltransferase Ste14
VTPTDTTDRKGRGPGVVIPPPLFFVAGFLLGWFLDRAIPVRERVLGAGRGSAASLRFETAVELTGVALILAGLAFSFWGIVTFHRMKTAIFPNRDASRLVIAGPYQWTRNPMYLGMSVAYVGLCLLLSAGWPLPILPLVLLTVRRLVIDREERYLSAAFGEEYRAYQRRVGRWL